jgi:hypothetical protein
VLTILQMKRLLQKRIYPHEHAGAPGDRDGDRHPTGRSSLDRSDDPKS